MPLRVDATQWHIKAPDIDYRSHCCSAKTTDKKRAFVKYRDELPMKFIERWLSRTSECSRKCPDEARNVYFRPAKSILLWSSSHADRRRSRTEMGYIDFMSHWNTCICTSSAAEDAGVSSLFISWLSHSDSRHLRRSISDKWVVLAVYKYIYVKYRNLNIKNMYVIRKTRNF